jgi:molybdate transport system substrate-binding protein
MRMDTGRLWVYLLPVAAMGVVAAGLSMLLVRPQEPHEEGPVTLSLYCAVEVRLPVESIVDRFQRRTGARVQAHYAPSHLLLKQIERSGNGDLLLSIDSLSIHQARGQEWSDAGRPIACLVPVILVSTAYPHPIRNVADLAAPGIRLGLASEETALGGITLAILQNSGIGMDHFERNRIHSEATAAELARAVEIGRIDAAIVWRPWAQQHAHQTTVVEIRPEHNVVSCLVAIVRTTSKHADAARDFVEFLHGKLAQDTFRKHHLLPQ